MKIPDLNENQIVFMVIVLVGLVLFVLPAIALICEAYVNR